MRDLFDHVRVFVCPLRYGAGAKGKIMSALAYGLPIVSTAIGVEGAGLEDGEHVLVADEAEDFAATVLRLYNDVTIWNRLSIAGQSLLEDKFSINMGVHVLEQAITEGHRRRLEVASSENFGFDPQTVKNSKWSGERLIESDMVYCRWNTDDEESKGDISFEGCAE